MLCVRNYRWQTIENESSVSPPTPAVTNFIAIVFIEMSFFEVQLNIENVGILLPLFQK